jgi:hypothetical protein
MAKKQSDPVKAIQYCEKELEKLRNKKLKKSKPRKVTEVIFTIPGKDGGKMLWYGYSGQWWWEARSVLAQAIVAAINELADKGHGIPAWFIPKKALGKDKQLSDEAHAKLTQDWKAYLRGIAARLDKATEDNDEKAIEAAIKDVAKVWISLWD